MANATTMVGTRAATLNTSAVSQNLLLDPDLRYMARHLQFETGGTEDLNLVKIELSKVADNSIDAAVANRTEDTDQLFLDDNNREIIIPRATSQINYIAFAGVPMINVFQIDRGISFGGT